MKFEQSCKGWKVGQNLYFDPHRLRELLTWKKDDVWNPYQLVNGIKGNFMALQTKFDCLFLTSKRRASFPIYIRSLHFEIMLYVDQDIPCELVKTKNYLIEAFFP